MKFNTLYVSKWTDGDFTDVRVIKTMSYSLHSMVAGDSCDRIAEIGKYCRANNIHSVVLCPGFTHQMVADVAKEVGAEISVAASRADGPGSLASAVVRNKVKKELKQ